MLTNDHNEAKSQADIEKILKDEASAVDVEELIRLGVLEKKGAWYQIHKWEDLPAKAKAGIIEVKIVPPLTTAEGLFTDDPTAGTPHAQGISLDTSMEMMLVKFSSVKKKSRAPRSPNKRFRETN